MDVLYAPECTIEQITRNDKLDGTRGEKRENSENSDSSQDSGSGELRCLLMTANPQNVSFTWHQLVPAEQNFGQNQLQLLHPHQLDHLNFRN